MAAKVSGTFRQLPNDPLNDCEVIVINIKDLTLKKIYTYNETALRMPTSFLDSPSLFEPSDYTSSNAIMRLKSRKNNKTLDAVPECPGHESSCCCSFVTAVYSRFAW